MIIEETSELRSMQDILAQAADVVADMGPQHLVVSPAPDVYTARGIRLALDAKLVRVTVIGDPTDAKSSMEEAGISSKSYKLVKKETPLNAVLHAVSMTMSSSEVLFLPGAIEVPEFFRHLFHLESSFLARSDFMSLVSVMESSEGGLFLVSDVGLVPDPTVDQGIAIIKNSVMLAKILGCKTIRVALLAYEDELTPYSPTTIAESMIERYFSEQGDPSVCVEGPIRLDRALLPNAIPCLPLPGIEQGPATILIANNIHVGNSMYKAMVTLCGMESAPIVMGGRVPIALPSQSESPKNILNSIALAVIVRRSERFNRSRPNRTVIHSTGER